MKEILSYWDISLGLIAIGFGSYRFIKYEKYKKKRDNDMLKKTNGIWKLSYKRYMDDRHAFFWCSFLIFVGVVFIYNRLNGNLPNIIALIKEFASY